MYFRQLKNGDRFIVLTPSGSSNGIFGDGESSNILQKFPCRGREEIKSFGYSHFAIRERDGVCLVVAPNEKAIRVVGQ